MRYVRASVSERVALRRLSANMNERKMMIAWSRIESFAEPTEALYVSNPIEMAVCLTETMVKTGPLGLDRKPVVELDLKRSCVC